MHFVFPSIIVVCVLFWTGLYVSLTIKVFIALIAVLFVAMLFWITFDTYHDSSTGHT